jgi:hypothetical protein
MIAFAGIIFSAASTLLLWLCLKKLDIISRDTRSRDELAESIDKFAALAGAAKSKVVAFRVKEKDGDV